MPGSWLATSVADTNPISSISGIFESGVAFSFLNSVVNSTAESRGIPPSNFPSSITGYVLEAPVMENFDEITTDEYRENNN